MTLSPQNPSDGSMAQVLESALLEALKPISKQIQSVDGQVTTQRLEIQTLRAETQALKTQLETQTQTQQTELGKSLASLLDSLKTFDERLKQNENKIEQIETQQTRMQNLLNTIDQKIPNAFNLPRKLTISGETLTYRGLIFLFLFLMTYTAGAVWFANQILPGISKETYNRINSVEIRLKRIENRLK